MGFKSLIFSILGYDIFNHQFFLRIGQKAKNSTTFSIILSQILLYGFLSYLIYSCVGMFQRLNPSINIQSFDINNRPLVNLNSKNFHFAFRIEDNDGNSLDLTDVYKYFEINVTYYQQQQEGGKWEVYNETNFDIKNCEKEDFSEFEDYFKTNLESAFCLAKHDFDLEGFWDEKSFKYLYITIDYCKENGPINCYSKEQREKNLKGSYFTVYMESQNVDANNYEHPLQKSLKYYSYLLDTNIKKAINFYIQQVELKTYDNLLLRSGHSSDYYYKQNFADVDFNSGFNNSNAQNAQWEIYLYRSNQVQIIERSYNTLLAVLAEIGGITKFLLMVGTFITLFYNQMKLYSILLNELFIFDTGEVKSVSESHHLPDQLQFNRLNVLKKEDEPINKPAGPLRIFSTFFENANQNLKMFHSQTLSPQKEEMENCQNIENNNRQDKFSYSNFNKFKNKSNTMQDLKNNGDLDIIQEKTKEEKTAEIQEKSNLINFESQFEMVPIEKPVPIQTKKISLDPDKMNFGEFTNENLADLDIERNNEKNKLQFSSWEILRSIFFPVFLSKKLKHKLKLYQNATKDLLKYINLIGLVQTLQQFEKLKMILFNKHQLVLFNYLSKPLITSKYDKSGPSLISKNTNGTETSRKRVTKMMRYLDPNNRKEQFKDILNYYNEIVDSGVYTDIDKRLFELLDDDLANTIDVLHKKKKSVVQS